MITFAVSEVVDFRIQVVIEASDGVEEPARFKTTPIAVKAGCCPDSS